ncbi:MAG: monovalent cation/H+ antiporter subunit D family protein [Bacteriovoracaceae bacterium]
MASVIKFGIVLSIGTLVWDGYTPEVTLFNIAPDIGFTLKVDAFGLYFALIASGLWILATIYSIGYMRGHGEKNQTRFFASFALSLSATIGIAFSGNLLTFIIFYEILTLATYPLVVHKGDEKAIRAGRKYLAYSLTAGVLLIVGAGWIYGLTGEINFVPGGIFSESLINSLPQASAWILFCLLLVGFGVKSAIMPFHSWLPNAMVAPTPVSALLHAVAVVKSGVFAVVRIVHFVLGTEMMQHFNLHILLGALAGATIIIASLIALRQDNLKRRLAYSTIGHLSYIVLGVALLSPEGLVGGILHISAHAFMKITLFFCAGAILVHVHKENVSDLNGIGRAMPWTMGAFTIGALGLAGIPPINGFVSKWFLVAGTVQAETYVGLSVYLLSGLLNAAYFFPIVHRAFFRASNQYDNYGEATPWMVAPICIASLLALLFGIFPNMGVGFYDLSVNIVNMVM